MATESYTVTLNGQTIGVYASKERADIKARILLRANRGSQVLIIHDKIYTGPQAVQQAG